MRISDWSSDVCSSDLAAILPHRLARQEHDRRQNDGTQLLARGQIRELEYSQVGADLQGRLTCEETAVGAGAGKGPHRNRQFFTLNMLSGVQRLDNAVD